MNLKSMPVTKLMALKDKIDALVQAKVAERRRELESDLARLTRFGTGGKQGRPVRSLRGSKVAPKYRNPDNPSETWAGRGLQPKWLAAAIKAGKKLEHFAIAAPAKASAVKKSRGRPRKK
jgi:DNA-binding protein H-NS